MKESIWEWIRVHILRRKPSMWIKKKIELTYWTRNDGEANISVLSLKFEPVGQPIYIDKLQFKVGDKEYPKILIEG